MPDCDILIPPDCVNWTPARVFERDSAHCRAEQSQYVVQCAQGLSVYYSTLLGVIATFLGVQLLVLACVLIYLRRARQRALTQQPPEMEETLAQGMAMSRSRRSQSQDDPGSSLVLPAYYWFLRFECILCSLWICFYGVCIWMETDPSQKWVLSSETPDSRAAPEWSPTFIVPKALVFACNALGTTLDATLMLFLAQKNAGHKVWQFSLRAGLVLGFISGTLSILPSIICAYSPSVVMGAIRLSGYTNDGLIRLIIIVVVCLPIALYTTRECSDEEPIDDRRLSARFLAIFKLVFALVALGLAIYFFHSIPDGALRGTEGWDIYTDVFKRKIFPARMACFAPWAFFFVLNGLVVYRVLWLDSQYWRKAGVRVSMFHESQNLADPLLRAGRYPSPRKSSVITPRFNSGDIIDFTAISLVRKVGGGASSIVWEAKLRTKKVEPSRRSTVSGSSRSTSVSGVRLKRVAVKQLLFIDDITASTIEAVCREAEFLRALGNHPNIIGWHGLCVSPPHLLLVTELCRPNLLCTHLAAGSRFIGRLTLRARLQVAAGIANALIHLHTFGVVMRDLKCCNVLLDNKSLTPKLCDFGIARLMKNRSHSVEDGFSLNNPEAHLKCGLFGLCCDTAGSRMASGSACGTIEYMAPEAVAKIYDHEREVLEDWERVEQGLEKILNKKPRLDLPPPHAPGNLDTKGDKQNPGGGRERSWTERGRRGSGTSSRGGSAGRSPQRECKEDDNMMAALDVYSLGVFMWSLLYIQDPWAGLGRQEVMSRIVSGQRLDVRRVPAILADHNEMWEDLRNLLHRCWSTEPSRRPKASSVRIMLTSMTRKLQENSPPVERINVDAADEKVPFGSGPQPRRLTM